MRVAVVGAAGFLGRFVAEDIARRGVSVVPILRSTPLPGGRFDAVVDCNGDSRRFWAERNPAESFQVNVASVCERLLRLRTDLYVFASTIDVYGGAAATRHATREDASAAPESMVTYGFHKYLAELTVRHHAQRALILRLGTLIGPGLKKNPVYDLLNGAPLRQTGDSTLSLIDLDHVARALWLLVSEGAEGVFNVTSTASITIEEITRRVVDATGRPSPPPHPECLFTSYDIAVEKLSARMALPTSTEVLDRFLAAGQCRDRSRG